MTSVDHVAPAHASSGARPTLGTAGIGMLAVLIYIMVVGGTGSGELNPVLRALTAGFAAILIVAYMIRVPGRADRVDAAMVMGLALFAVAGTLSLFPRQSFDAVLAATAYVAGFFLARMHLAREPVRATLIHVLMGLSALFTVGTAIAWLPYFLEWWSLTGWTGAPRLDLPLSGGPWGYRYDVALLIALLYPAWWIGRPSPARRIAAAGVGLAGLVVIVVAGSRTVWLAMVVASLAVGVPAALRWWNRRHDAWWIAIIAAILSVGVLVSGVMNPLLDRGLSLASLDWRLAMWGPLIDLWQSHPVAGVGPGSFPWALQLTPYFETNTLAPRHPDSPIIQLLAEAGLLGLAAAVLVLAAALTVVIRGRSSAARWAVIAGCVACLGTNPTDFAFLLVILLAWIAYAAPHQLPTQRGGPGIRSKPILAALAATAVIFVAHAATLVGAFAYDAARSSVDRWDFAAAHAALNVAVALDPGMALYWRQRGTASYLLGYPDRALEDLAIATELNPVDDLAWRVTALARVRDGPRAATTAMETALAIQRSDVANLLVAAWLSDRYGREEAAVVTLAEVVQAWPTVIGAPGWSALVPDGRGADVLEEAAARWARGAPLPHQYAGQDVWLATVMNGEDLAPGSTESALSSALRASRRCEAEADNFLQGVGVAERRSFEYWETRVRVAANRGTVDDEALRGYHLSAGTDRPRSFDATINPLNEGSWWGYRRMPIFWPSTTPQLPDPYSGELRWMLAPHEAVAEAGLEAQLPEC